MTDYLATYQITETGLFSLIDIIFCEPREHREIRRITADSLREARKKARSYMKNDIAIDYDGCARGKVLSVDEVVD